MEVLVDCPGTQELYLYSVPDTLEVSPGDILSVPFGGRQVGGIAIRPAMTLPEGLAIETVRPLEDVVSRQFFPHQYWSLLEQVATYYCTPLIQVIRTALPPGLLGRSQRRIRLLPAALPPEPASGFPAAQSLLEKLRSSKTGDYTWQFLQRQVPGARAGLRELLRLGWVESYLEPPTPVQAKQRQAVTLVSHSETALSDRQREVLEVLRRNGGDLWLQDLLQQCRVSSSVVKTLEQKGCVVVQSREVLRSEAGGNPAPDKPKALTADQQQVLEQMTAIAHYRPVLLHGVTGSGKTEVYLQAIAPLLKQGKSALVLVPEIGLTPQLTDRFRARFGNSVLVYHSALSEGERYDTWRRMLEGQPQIVIGTRSAIFAPLPNLGMIILDEEHDDSFKQDQPAPCYHARTVAFWRAELVDCPLVLGSATPALETWTQFSRVSALELEDDARSGNLGDRPTGDLCSDRPTDSPLLLSLPQRIHARPSPPIEVVDMRAELAQGNRSLFSRCLRDALDTLLEQRQQGILFIPRRGHSTFVSCRSCGFVIHCPHCDISLAYHQPQPGATATLRCHYCGHGQLHPPHCPACGSPYLKHFGSGTQRVVQELAEEFPDLRCIRYDSDTTRTKGSHRALLTRFAQGEADLLVGTQMLTKGIDLPQVTLVGVLAADGLLHLADYRASERSFQILLQVAGRSGRGEEPGRVILQTYSPNHPVIAAVQNQAYAAFAATELTHRQEMAYPPHRRLIALRISGLEARAVQRTAERLAFRIAEVMPEYEILGPAPAAIARVAQRYRWQILLKGKVGATVPERLAEMRSYCPPGISLTVDVDPLHLL